MSGLIEISNSPHSTFEMDDPVDTFTGRVDELNKLHTFLENNEKHTVLFGMGGVGKTELVRKYVEINKANYLGNILFINAENHFQMRLSFVKIATTLGLSTKTSDGKEMDDKLLITSVYKMLHGMKCIFIMDNATYYQKHDNPQISCRDYLPMPASDYTSFRFLFTTRNPLFYKNGNTIELKTFSEDESIELLKKSLSSIIIDESDLIKLHNYMEGLPLALQQAAALIKLKNQESLVNSSEHNDARKSYGVSDYLNEYDAAIKIPHDNSYTKTVYTTWEVSLNHIKSGILTDSFDNNNRLALKMLQMCAYYSPDGINVEMFAPLVQFNMEKLAGILRIPKQYSLFQLSKGIIRIHRLIQKVIRLQLENNKQEEDFLKFMLDINLILVHSKYISPFNHVHMIHLWNHAVPYKMVVTQFSKTPWSIAQFMLIGGFYSSAVDFCKMAGPQIRIVLGDNVNDSFKSLNDVILVDLIQANCYQKQGKHVKAVKILKAILVIQMQSVHFGSQNPNTHLTENHIGQCFFQMGKFDEALSWIENLLEKQIKIHEKDDGRILDSLMTKAAILNGKGAKEEALKIYRDVLAMESQKIAHEKNATTAIILAVKNNIANILMDQSDFKEALKFYTEIREIYLVARDYGKKHPATIEVSINMAILLNKMGLHENSLAMYDEVINLPEIAHKDPMKVLCQHSKASVLMSLDRLPEAKDLLSQVVETREEMYGPEHPDTLLAKFNLALCFSYLENFSEAEKIIDGVIQVSQSCFGDTHSDTVKATTLKANILRANGLVEEALEMLEKNYKIQMELGENISETLDTLKCIALCQYELKRLDKSFENCKNILKKMLPVYGDKHPKVADIINNIAVILYDQGEIDLSLEMQLSNFKTRIDILPLDHSDLKCTIDSIMKIYQEGRKFSELKTFVTEHHTRCSESLGKNHPTTLSILEELIWNTIQFRKYKDALTHCNECLDHCTTSSSSECIIRYFKALCLRKLKMCKAALAEIKVAKNIESNDDELKFVIQVEEAKINNALTNKPDISVFAKIYKKQSDSNLRLNTLRIISNIFRTTGRFKQSLIINSHIHSEFTLSRGSSYPDTLMAELFIANSLRDFGLFDLSLILYRRVMLGLKQRFDENHPFVQDSNYNFEDFMIRANNWIYKMLNLFLYLYEIRKNKFSCYEI